MKKNNLYLYLARLDKKGIKVLTSFIYDKKVFPTRVKDVRDLNMKPGVHAMISKEIHDNRMRYELFAETAESFAELKNSLRKRGYTELPLGQFTGYTDPTSINSLALVTENSSMTRRATQLRG